MMLLVFLVLLSSLHGIFTAESELTCSHQPIVALVGDDVILPCGLEPPISASSQTVEWTRPDLDPKYIHVHRDRKQMFELQHPSYLRRTRLFVNELINGNVSLKIFSVNISDAGTYKCFLPSMHKEASVQLIVGELEVIGSHEAVTAAVGDDVILPCHLEPPLDVTMQTVEWNHNGTIVHLYHSKEDDLIDQDENFSGRTSLFHEEMIRGNISLKLTNVTEQDAGEYTCFVPELDGGVKRGFVSLIVGVDTFDLYTIIVMAGAAAAALVVLCALFAVLVCGCRRRSKSVSKSSTGADESQELDQFTVNLEKLSNPSASPQPIPSFLHSAPDSET